jgi:transcriptional regulator with XRE-family HTH domain
LSGYHKTHLPTHYQMLIEALAIERRKRDISQEEMSHMLGVSERLVNNWECGFKQPSSHLLMKWIAVLGGVFHFPPHPLSAGDVIEAYPVYEKRKSSFELLDFIVSTHGEVRFEAV